MLWMRTKSFEEVLENTRDAFEVPTNASDGLVLRSTQFAN